MPALSRAALFAALLSTSCFSPGEGVPPSRDSIYFPVAIALNRQTSSSGTQVSNAAVAPTNPTVLYVINSDFDLQFNAGTVQSYELGHTQQGSRAPGIRALVPAYCRTKDDCVNPGIDGTVPCSAEGGNKCTCAAESDPTLPPWCVAELDKPCGSFGSKSAADREMSPGLCAFIDPVHPQDGSPKLLDDSVEIGAFATDAIYREPPSVEAGAGRLFIPVRGDASLHWIDVTADGKLDCGQTGNSGRCDELHRAGKDATENTRQLRLPTEPYGIDATEDGHVVVLTHQTEGKLSLFLQDETGDGRFDTRGPHLEFIVENLPSSPVGLAAIPRPILADDVAATADNPYQPGFLVTYRNAPEVDLVRFNADADSSPARPFLSRTASTPIRANSVGTDSRGIAIDAAERRACENACATNDVACLRGCLADHPLSVYVANRTPETLLIGRTRRAESDPFGDELPAFTDTVDLSTGPSRVVVGQIIDVFGRVAKRVFVVCFDAHIIYGYDPATGEIDTQIQTGRGPSAFVTDIDVEHADPAHALGYVAHFTDSYLGVIDLDQRHSTFGTILVTLGRPTAPRAQK